MFLIYRPLSANKKIIPKTQKRVSFSLPSESEMFFGRAKFAFRNFCGNVSQKQAGEESAIIFRQTMVTFY